MENDHGYNVRVLANGPDIRVWWGEEGETMTQIMGTSVCRVLDSEIMWIWCHEDGEFAFDDIVINAKNNLGQFLHLKSDSPCIDATDTDQHAGTYRDFDDQMGPLTLVTPTPELIYRDMGADEHPQAEASAYWWENF